MGLETGTFVDDLVTTNPVGASDDFNQGDDHLRLIKSILKNTFPNATRAFRFPDAPAAKTTAYTVVVGDENALIQGATAGGAFTVTLPLLSAVNDGFQVQVMKSDSAANDLTIDGNGAETINGASTLVLTNQFDFAFLKKDASEWKVIGRVDAGTAVTSSSTNTFSNKTVDSAVNTLTLDLGEGTLTGTLAEFNAALQSGSFASLAGTEVLTNKTIDGDLNTLQDIGVAALKNGVDGELITWDAAAAPATVPVGTAAQVLTSNGAGAAPTFQTPATSGLTLGTPVATTSGTTASFTGIPSGTKQITVSFNGVSFNLAVPMLLQIGDAGGLETSGYISGGNNGTTTTESTIAFFLNDQASQGDTFTGSITLTLLNSSTNVWVASGVFHTDAGNILWHNAGRKALSGELTQLQINGGTFDAGEINIAYI